MVGNVVTACPPDRILPNQEDASLPMVCRWRPRTRLGHDYATGHEVSHSRRLPWCAESAKKQVEESVLFGANEKNHSCM